MIKIKKQNDFQHYVPIADRQSPESEQTVFVMRVLGRKKLLDATQESITVNRDGGYNVPLTMGIDLVIRQLSGWKNVCDEDGVEIPFDPKNKQACFDLLPDDIQGELLAVFQGGSRSRDAELAVELEHLQSEQRHKLTLQLIESMRNMESGEDVTKEVEAAQALLESTRSDASDERDLKSVD